MKTNIITIEISPGELADRLSILEIKRLNIKDQEKLDAIYDEYDRLNNIAINVGIPEREWGFLYDINLLLWNAEDEIREYERASFFGKEFIDVARSIYKLNDERCRIKNEITKKSGSDLIEIKSHKG